MKSRISPALMMCALVLGAASPAFAQQQDGNGPGQHGDQGGHGGDRGGSRDQGPGGRGGREGGPGGPGGNGPGGNGPGGNGPGGNGPGGHFAGDQGPGGPGGPGGGPGGGDRGGHREWNRGDRYDGNRQFVDDWRGRGLREPPPGHRWVRDQYGDYVLVALASGIIADILLNNGR